MTQKFTGRKMAGVMVIGFAIVIAVNFTMAYHATSGFSGVVVDNSYVASQKFNGWLDEAEAQRALGWNAQVGRSAESLVVTTQGVPESAEINARIRRPLGEADVRSVAFDASGDGTFLSRETVPEGRWIVRLTIESNGQAWREEYSLR